MTSVVSYGQAVGVNLLRAGRFRRGLRYMFQPVAYWRSIEYRLVCNAAHFQASDRILDVGSPKLLSLYLADQVGAEVFATDIDSWLKGNLLAPFGMNSSGYVWNEAWEKQDAWPHDAEGKPFPKSRSVH